MKGETIEVCELILLDMNQIQADLEGYVYQYNKKTAALALGNGSLYNHNDKPNAVFYFDYRKKLLYIKAAKNIEPDQEITINYGYDISLKKRFNIIS